MTDDVADLVARLHADQPDVVLLGEVLSLAAYVEPALLRRARLLFTPTATAELEGRFWFSPLVESAGPDHLHLDPVLAEALRSRLASRPDAPAARALIRAAHEHADPAVVLFESLVWAVSLPDAEPSRVAEPLLRLATTMHDDPDRAVDVARWTLRYVPRLPVALRDTDCAVAVRLLAADKLGVQVSVPEVTAGAAALVNGSVPSTSDHTDRYGVRLTSHGVVISTPPEPGAEVVELSAPGRILRVAAPGGGLARHVQVTPGVPVEVAFGYLAQVTADGRVLRTVALPGRIVDIAADQDLHTVVVAFADGTVRYGRWADDPAGWTRGVRGEREPIALVMRGLLEAMGLVFRPAVGTAIVGVGTLAVRDDFHGLVASRSYGRMWLLPLDFIPQTLIGLVDDAVLTAGSGGPLEVSGRVGGRAAVLVPRVVAERSAPEPAPAWYRSAVFYELLVETFRDSDGDGWGDLAGVTEKLDHLRWLGIDCVSLGPIQSASYSRGLGERYGTLSDLVLLLDEAHGRGLRVVAELAVERVPDEMLDTVWFWLDLGLDGIRIAGDAGVFDSPAFRRRVLDDHPDRVLILDSRERDVPGDEEGVLLLDTRLAARLFLAATHENRYSMPLGSVSGFFLRDRNVLSLRDLLVDERRHVHDTYARDPRMVDEDGIRRRLAPLLGNDRTQVELFLSLLFSLADAPFLYYGDEIGMGDNIWLPDSDSVRTPMQWTSDRNGGFSDGSPGRMIRPMVSTPDYGYHVVNVESQRNDDNSLLHRTRGLIEARRSCTAFSAGELVNLATSNDGVLAYLRVDGDEVVLCVANLTARFQAVRLDLSAYEGRVLRDLLTHENWFPIDRSSRAITLSGHEFLWALLVDPGEAT